MLDRNRNTEKQGMLELLGPSAVLVIVVLIFCTLAISGAFPAESETEPTAEAVLDAYVQATGGLEAYDAIHNRTTDVRMTIEGAGITLEGSILIAKPNRSYTLLSSDMIGTIEKGTDGDLVWEKNTMSGPQIVEGEMRRFTLREGTLDKIVYWRDLYPGGAELAGSAEVEGRDCHKVVLKPESGEPVVLYFDKETHLALRQDITVASPMGTVPVESVMSDYTEVDGVLLPFTVTVGNLGQKRVITTTSVKHNLDLPEDRFAAPADVLALLTPPTEAGE